MKIMCNGTLIDADQPIITAQDRGLLLADGLFETLRVDNKKILRFEQHMTRLRKSADYFSIPLNDSNNRIHEMMQQLLLENTLTNASLRLTLTRGTGPRGVLPPNVPKPTLLITANTYLTPSPKGTAMLIDHIRRNETSPTSQHKTLNYTDNILAAQYAQQHGADVAILQNTKGFLACAHAANIFIKLDGQLYTPPIKDGALPGITREHTLKTQTVICESLPAESLYLAQEIFITNSLLGTLPIKLIDAKTDMIYTHSELKK